MQTLLLLLVVSPLVLANQYIRQPYQNDAFSASVKFGDNHTLRCEDENEMNPSSIEYWILPNNMVLKMSEAFSLDPHPIDGVGSWRVSANASEIHIVNLMEAHFGLYHCMTKDADGDLYAVKKGINYNGPYFGDLWEIYRTNTMVGGIAAAVFVVLVTIFYVIYLFRFKSDDSDEDPNIQAYENAYDKADTLPATHRLGGAAGHSAAYSNQAYDSVDEVAQQPSRRAEDNTQL